MSTQITPPTTAIDDLHTAVDRLARGIRDPEAMLQACERMDKMREELQSRVGTIDIAVDLIRDARDR
jgi:hypothetical protein